MTRIRPLALVFALATAIAFVLALDVTRAAAQGASRDWRPEERTIIGDFSRVTSVAAGREGIYATSLYSLVIWDPRFRQWKGPFQPPVPTQLAGVFAALVDPIDQSVWLARTDGWLHFQPDLELWESGTSVGTVRDIAFDLDAPTSGLYLLTSSGWLIAPRGGGTAFPTNPPARPQRPTRVADALRANPALQANSPQLFFRNSARPVRFTSAAASPDGLGWYIGTVGLGLLFMPDAAALPEQLSFGLPEQIVGSVYPVPGGVWAATDAGYSSPAALTFVGEELERFETTRGAPALGLGFTRTRKLAGLGRALWAATDAGLARMEPGQDRADIVDQGLGLPDQRVLSLVARRGRITVGTARGLARVSDSLEVQRVAPGFNGTAYAVEVAGDSVWVGTGTGLYVVPPGAPDLVRPAALGTARFQVPIVGLTWVADTLVAMSRDELLWRRPGGEWTLGPNLSALLGRLLAITPADGGVWVGGDHGFAFARLGSPPIRPILERDLPGEVFDLAADEKYLWVATDGGLVRFLLDAIEP